MGFYAKFDCGRGGGGWIGGWIGGWGVLEGGGSKNSPWISLSRLNFGSNGQTFMNVLPSIWGGWRIFTASFAVYGVDVLKNVSCWRCVQSADDLFCGIAQQQKTKKKKKREKKKQKDKQTDRYAEDKNQHAFVYCINHLPDLVMLYYVHDKVI